MDFPLQLTFKLIAFAPQIFVRTANGASVAYVRQKLFRLKEHIEVFKDASKSALLYEIRADRMLDFSANYTFSDASGRKLGAVRRKGLRSLWSAHYEISDGATAQLEIREENPLAKVLDSLVGNIPIVGWVLTMLINPTYRVTRLSDNQTLLRIRKRPALFEGKFTVEKIGTLSDLEESRAMLSIMMMTLLERSRG